MLDARERALRVHESDIEEIDEPEGALYEPALPDDEDDEDEGEPTGELEEVEDLDDEEDLVVPAILEHTEGFLHGL